MLCLAGAAISNGACRQVPAASAVKVKSSITDITLTTSTGEVVDISSLTEAIRFLLPLDINLTDITHSENAEAGAKTGQCTSLLGADQEAEAVVMTPELIAARLQW